MTMDTAQLFFRVRNTKNAEDVLDKVQGYLAALLHNGQIVGDHMPMAKVSGGYLVTASLPESDALANRFADNRTRIRRSTGFSSDRDQASGLPTISCPVSTASYRRMAESWRASWRRRCASPCTTTSRSTSAAAIRQSANAGALPAESHGYARSLCTGSSTSNASAVGCYQTSRLMCGYLELFGDVAPDDCLRFSAP
jgi:hypothetical protein